MSNANKRAQTLQKGTILEILEVAKSDSEVKMRPNHLLAGSLQTAVNKLSKDFQHSNPFNPAGDSDSSDYFDMFQTVAENFSTLGRELLSMRSSYLPYKMLENVLEDLKDPGSKSKKLSEIIDADTTLESYENTFFRLLGMPSVADMDEQGLATVSSSGSWIDKSKDHGFVLTGRVLEKRAQDITDRLDAPTSNTYDFLTGAESSFTRLAALGWTNFEPLEKVIPLIKDLYGKNTRDENTARLAAQLLGLMDKERKVDMEASASERSEAQGLKAVFGPGGEQYDSKQFLQRMLKISLGWFEPTLVNRISPSLETHIWQEHIEGKADMTMANLMDKGNFWTYSHLLFPPVQDSRVATCISEPKKMVAEPFMPESMRTVNGHRLKSTLLEAVIRIRLDIVTGFPQKAPRVSSTGMSISTEGDERAISKDEMGLLEALLIVRLFTALHAFAEDAKSKILKAAKTQHRTSRAPSGPPPGETDQTQGGHEPKRKSVEQQKLESMRLVEESLLLLFGDGSTPEALSYQYGVARNSGVKDAHLMSAALAVLDVPKRWADKKLGEINEAQARAYEKVSTPATGGLRAQLGMSKGVGAIDMIAFLIALFTAQEECLLNLLTRKQFDNLKKEFPDDFFAKFETPEAGSYTMARAVDEISERAFDAYELFRFMLSPAFQKDRFVHQPIRNRMMA